MSKINDVAKLAGVSPSTVSRTLSNRVFVKEETRKKVLDAARQLNYQPSMLAKGLREGKSSTIALLVPDISSLFYPELMDAIEQLTSKSGYLLFLCSSHNSLEREKNTVKLLSTRGIDGMCCLSVCDDIEHIIQLHETMGIPVVMINRPSARQLNCVSVNNEKGGYQAVSYLLDRGHVRIAGIFGSLSHWHNRERFHGYQRALKEQNIFLPERYAVPNVSSFEEAYLHTKKLLESDTPPTAFFASMDILTVGIYRAVSEAGLRIPDDISVIGFDNISLAAYMVPPLTTCRLPIEEIALASVSCLLQQIENGGSSIFTLMDCQLIERSSVKSI